MSKEVDDLYHHEDRLHTALGFRAPKENGGRYRKDEPFELDYTILEENKEFLRKYVIFMTGKKATSRIVSDFYKLKTLARSFAKPFDIITRDDVDRVFAQITTQVKDARDYALRFRLFYRWLKGVDYDLPEVAALKKIRHKRQRFSPKDMITEEQLDKILAVMDSVRDRALVRTLYFTGLRPAELLLLKVGDLEEVCGVRGFAVNGTKTAFSIRSRPMIDAKAWELVDQVIAAHPCRNRPDFKECYLWTMNDRNEMLTHRAFYKRLSEAAKRALGYHIKPYLFRHTRISAEFTNEEYEKIPKAFRKRSSGWSLSSDEEDTYVHPDNKDIYRAYGKVGTAKQDVQQAAVDFAFDLLLAGLQDEKAGPELRRLAREKKELKERVNALSSLTGNKPVLFPDLSAEGVI